MRLGNKISSKKLNRSTKFLDAISDELKDDCNLFGMARTLLNFVRLLIVADA